jgi:hypothetical protein
VVGSVGVESGGGLTISDSTIDTGDQAGTGLGEHDFVALRVHVMGGNRSINCAATARCATPTCADSHRREGRSPRIGHWHGHAFDLVQNTIACDGQVR